MKNNVVGGKAYDVFHLTCAEKCGANRIYTFNVRDFGQLAGTSGQQKRISRELGGTGEFAFFQPCIGHLFSQM